jgi:hypothetical protein
VVAACDGHVSPKGASLIVLQCMTVPRTIT